MSSYKCISDFGQNSNNPSNNPLNYCLFSKLDNGFNNGSTSAELNQNSRNCQAFMSDYCASNWNGICERESKNRNKSFPNNLQKCNTYSGIECVDNMNLGDVLVANTASKKYLSKMLGSNCTLNYEPFDPNVAGSPMINYWGGTCNNIGDQGCVPVYEVDPTNIDNDPVMNKILNNPIIAWSILINIYNTSLRLGTLENLKGTKLYKFFHLQEFQSYINSSKS